MNVLFISICKDLGLKVHLLPEKLLRSIESLLNDSLERIRSAAAIALVTLNRFSPQVFILINIFVFRIIFSSSQVEEILRLCIIQGNPEDRLTAALCLASVNLTTSDIITELLKNYFNAEDELTREQLILSLAKTSQRTV